MKRVLLFIFTISVQLVFAQFRGQVPEAVKYSASKVVDPEYGITMYEKLNFQVGGDSVRNDKKGYSIQGWMSDFYESGAPIHKGYYEDGCLKIYKNFYENGVVERSFKVSDLRRCNMQLFYPEGKLKSDISYYDGNPQIWTDYYKNGQIEYAEESTKNMEHLIFRRSSAEDGKPQEIFEITDQKKKIYSKKEYSENGNIKAEGQMKYNSSVNDYQKNGKWNIYNDLGILISEENWVNGELR